MNISHNIVQSIGIYSIVILLTVPAIADEDKVLEQLYKQFNSSLVNASLTNVNRLPGEDNINDSLKLLNAVSIDLPRSFYSRKLAASNSECYSRPLCRESDLIFLSGIAFTEYKLVSTGKLIGNQLKMGVSGLNGSATRIKLVIVWVREAGEWKIDKLMKVPANWNIRFR